MEHPSLHMVVAVVEEEGVLQAYLDLVVEGAGVRSHVVHSLVLHGQHLRHFGRSLVQNSRMDLDYSCCMPY
jgi:hypothetical protein